MLFEFYRKVAGLYMLIRDGHHGTLLIPLRLQLEKLGVLAAFVQ